MCLNLNSKNNKNYQLLTYSETETITYLEIIFIHVPGCGFANFNKLILLIN